MGGLRGATVITMLIGLLLTGCEQYATYTPSAPDLTALAEQYHGDDKAMVQETAVARYLAAEDARAAQEQAVAQIAALEATRQAAAAAEQRQYVALTSVAQQTADAHRRETEQKNQWATQQAANATQCAQATAMAISVQMTAQAMAIQATAEQRSYEATATADALNRQATATAEARSYEATATAQYKADVATATRQAWEGRQTATSESVQATAGAYQATATRAAEEREIVLGYGRDYGIPLALVSIACGAGALVVYGLREYKKRPMIHPRNFLGDAEPMAVPVEGGGYTFVDLDRQPGPVLQILPSGKVIAPQLRNEGQEERTTARDQAVDAMTRPKLGGGARGAGLGLPAPPTAPGLRSVRMFRRLDQAGKVGILSPMLTESLEADWEECDE